jgi:hypothetical protein
MARKESSRQPRQEQEVIGYPDKPMSTRYIVAAAVAWTLWVGFLLVMAYIRQAEWPFWPT